MFFSEKSTQESLQEFIRKSGQTMGGSEQTSHMISSAREVIRNIAAQTKIWDERCTFNISNVGDLLIKRLNSFDPSNPDGIEDIFVLTYRFLREYELSMPTNRELNPDLLRIKNNVEFGLTELVQDTRSQIIYAAYLMPAQIISDKLRHPDIDNFSQFE